MDAVALGGAAGRAGAAGVCGGTGGRLAAKGLELCASSGAAWVCTGAGTGTGTGGTAAAKVEVGVDVYTKPRGCDHCVALVATRM